MSAFWKAKESTELLPQINKNYYTLKTLKVIAPLMALYPEIHRKILNVTVLIQVYHYFISTFPPFSHVLLVLKCELNRA